jgi:hypothetical protein
LNGTSRASASSRLSSFRRYRGRPATSSQSIGPRLQWQESFVTADKIYCVYIAANEQLIRDHAREGGFPIAQISEVKALIDPVTAEIGQLR